MQKNSAHNFPREEVHFSLGNIELFAYFNLKKKHFLLGQGLFQSESNCYTTLPVVGMF